MTEPAAPYEFRIEKGEFRMPAFLEVAGKALLALSPLDAVRAATSPGFWGGAARSVVDAGVQLANVNVANVLVNAWKVHRKLRKYANRSLYPPGETSVVPLLEHEVTGSLDPSVEITIDGQPQGSVEFELELAIALEGAILAIRDGRIMRMDRGTAQVTGTFKCAGVVVAEKATRKYAWAGGADFGAGIPIVAEG